MYVCMYIHKYIYIYIYIYIFKEGNTPLLWATNKGYGQGCSDTDTVLLLLKYKANIEATDKVSIYPIFVHISISTSMYLPVSISISGYIYLSISYIYAPTAVIGGVEECTLNGGAEECTMNTRS